MTDPEEREKLMAALVKAEAEVAELQAGADLRWNADQRAIKRWQKAAGKKLVWPDHADLCVWLLKQLEGRDRRMAKIRHDPYPTKHDPNLLQVALNIHMATVGSYEEACGSGQVRANLAFLRKRLREWKPTVHAPCEAFDDACKALFIVVVEEARKKKAAK